MKLYYIGASNNSELDRFCIDVRKRLYEYYDGKNGTPRLVEDNLDKDDKNYYGWELIFDNGRHVTCYEDISDNLTHLHEYAVNLSRSVQSIVEFVESISSKDTDQYIHNFIDSIRVNLMKQLKNRCYQYRPRYMYGDSYYPNDYVRGTIDVDISFRYDNQYFEDCPWIINYEFTNLNIYYDNEIFDIQITLEGKKHKKTTDLLLSIFIGFPKTIRFTTELDVNDIVNQICDKLPQAVSEIKTKQEAEAKQQKSKQSNTINYSDIDFKNWLDSEEHMDDFIDFYNSIETKLHKKYSGCDVFEEPSTEGLVGSDFWTITMKDGDECDIEFDYEEEMIDLFTLGYKKAATKYANAIIKKMELDE